VTFCRPTFDTDALDASNANYRASEPGAAPGVSRRAAVVWLGLAASATAAAVEDMRRAPASQPPAAVAPPALDAAEAGFLVFSRSMTGHGDLAPQTAQRIYAAMTQRSADFPMQAQRLAQLAMTAAEPSALLTSASEAGLRDTALAVVAAWYTGTVGSGGRASVVAYADALMYAPVRDAQTAPTYCADGPAWWTRDPPPVGVSPPVEKAATAPPTTGFPMPTTGSPPPPRTEPQGSTPAGGAK
jgi:hypothetical protein